MQKKDKNHITSPEKKNHIHIDRFRKIIDPDSVPIHDGSSWQTRDREGFSQMRKNKTGNYTNQKQKPLRMKRGKISCYSCKTC